MRTPANVRYVKTTPLIANSSLPSNYLSNSLVQSTNIENESNDFLDPHNFSAILQCDGNDSILSNYLNDSIGEILESQSNKNSSSFISKSSSKLPSELNCMEIPTQIGFRPPKEYVHDYRINSNVPVNRINKLNISSGLPSVLNINPRSVYNKIIEFHDLIEHYEIDLICMSESWKREDKTLRKL